VERDAEWPEKASVRIHGARPGIVWHGWSLETLEKPKTDQWERTFAVLTGEPNELMAPIHDRMTTFLEPRDNEEYLAPAERAPVHLLRIFPDSKSKSQIVHVKTISNKLVSLFDPVLLVELSGTLLS
jgi:putative SOS response-associated peptidase YedK